MQALFYSMRFRHCYNWKADPGDIRINNHLISVVADKMNIQLRIAFPSREHKDTTDGLSYLCAYMMIPYGKEGRQYVAEKIYPKTIEEFMKEKATEVLGTVGIHDIEENGELFAAMEEYCRIYAQTTVPYSPAGVALLITRFNSEEIKSSKSTFGGVWAPNGENEKFIAYTSHYLSILRGLREICPDELDLEELLPKILSKRPYPIVFEFTDAHRQEIDNLPLFTGYAK